MPELLLEGIEPPAVVQEVDGVTVAEQVSVHPTLEPCPPGCSLGDKDKLLTSS